MYEFEYFKCKFVRIKSKLADKRLAEFISGSPTYGISIFLGMENQISFGMKRWGWGRGEYSMYMALYDVHIKI
jgi:hypothetical protein